MLRLVLFITLVASTFLASAQQIYQEKFGQNRVQYKKFLWQYMSTYNFDIYFHYGGEDMARLTADFAEREISRISHEIDYNSYRRYKIFIYNSVNDIEQSNIGLETGQFIGGQTEFVKPIIEVAFEGNINDFKQQISFGLSKTLLSFMFYGGSLKDVFRSSFFLALPEWYINGAAAHLAYGWDNEMDNYIRKKVSLKKLHSPASYRGKEATIIGQSVWNYIEEAYGPGTFHRAIGLTRIYRKEKKSLEATLDVPYKQFVKDWIAFYKIDSDENAEYYELAERSKRLKKRNRFGKKYYEVKMSSDASYMAYATNKVGKYRVYVRDLKKGRTRRLRTGSYKRYDQLVGYNNPALAWKQDHILSVVTYKKGKAHHRQYDFKEKKKKTRGLGDFTQTLSFSYSTDGELVLISGDVRGKTDIWVWDLGRNNLKQLTMDPYNDLDPVFVPNSRFEFVFSSSRPLEGSTNDSLLNLFLFDYRNATMKAITSVGNNYHPVFKNKDELYFISDRTGISNVFCYNLPTGDLKQVTHFYYDVKDFSLAADSPELFSYVLNEGGNDFLYLDSLTYFPLNEIAPYTSMGKKHTLKQNFQQRSQGKDSEESSELLPTPIKEEDFNFDNLIFESEYEKKKALADAQKKKDDLGDQNQIDPAQNNQPNLIKVKGPYKYKKIFGIDAVTTALMVDPLRGMGILLDGQMSDLLQNNRFDLGLFILGDFKNSNMYAEYLILKHRLDFQFRYDRQAYLASGNNVIQSYTLNRFTVGISYPINPHQRIVFSPIVTQTRFSDLSDLVTLQNDPDVVNVYTGGKVEWVYDFTRYYGLNMKAGTVAKVFVESHRHTTDATKNFSQFLVDIRHYQPVHRALLLALRASYGQFFGSSPKKYLLGGMDNWLFNSTDQTNPNSPLQVQYQKDNSDVLFNRFVTNVRGFQYNTQFGERFLVFNAELRFPIAQYLYKGTIGSAFLRNLQLITFVDAGSAWNGNNPFGTDNSISTQTINEPPFKAVVTNYRNPFLVGYGAGIRSLLVGYYMKFDVAWGIKNNLIQTPMFYFTLGHDF
ncbi:MAG: repeat-containing protein [Chitinophagaceae bacterium]|nr:repeat-containing protein [Chitinophagaceae bacterium]